MTTIKAQLEATHAGVVAADQAYLDAALGAVEWEERGWLKRLVRVPRLEEPRRLERAAEQRYRELAA